MDTSISGIVLDSIKGAKATIKAKVLLTQDPCDLKDDDDIWIGLPQIIRETPDLNQTEVYDAVQDMLKQGVLSSKITIDEDRVISESGEVIFIRLNEVN